MAIDTLQTLPSFVYLMPAVMLFRVGDFTAMIAVVAFAVAPAIRYTALGIRKVDPKLIEAGGDGLHRMADPDAYPAQAGACPKSCSG
jgi:ABC-type proline/glycine betaine transport system permease subunit